MFKKIIQELIEEIKIFSYSAYYPVYTVFVKLDNALFEYWLQNSQITYVKKEDLEKRPEMYNDRKEIYAIWKIYKRRIYVRLIITGSFLLIYEIFRFFYKRHKKNEKFDREIEELMRKDGFERPKRSNRKD